MIHYKNLGDSALLVEFPQEISPATHSSVVGLNRAIEQAAIPGVLGCTPAYCSITVRFDPLRINANHLEKNIQSICQRPPISLGDNNSRKLMIPVCYSTPYALDMQELERQLGISEMEIIALHAESVFQVYLLGFLPGFAYMGLLPGPLVCSRKTAPRIEVPAGSVGLAGRQTGIYPMAAPGGWQIIGRTPLPVFAPLSENPFLFSVGDEVRFWPISQHEFSKIEQDVAGGKFDYNSLYEYS